LENDWKTIDHCGGRLLTRGLTAVGALRQRT
jgi:hypothetical protein